MFINSLFDLFCFEGPADPNDPAGGGGTTDPKPNTVSRDAYDRVLNETKAERDKRKTLETELAAYKQKETEAAEADALKRGEFDKLLQAERDRTAAEAAKNAELNKALTAVAERELYNKKSEAFLDALGTPIERKYWDLVNVDNVKVNADGSIDKASAAEYANAFKAEFANILTPSNASNFPNTTPKGGTGASFKDAKTLKDKYEALPGAVEQRIRELQSKK